MQLTEFLEKFCVNKNAFCKKAGISMQSLHNFTKNGKAASWPLAEAISKATEGIVTLEEIKKIPKN